jgi:glycosylphosphatidylinositol transamidase
MATPTALPPLPFNPSRVRSYLVRLPLFTRLVLLVILVFWLLEFQTVWSVVQWGALIPDECNLGTSRSLDPRGSNPAIQRIRLMFFFIIIVYRLNTYPLIHTGFFHAALNTLALTPLLERFEAEHGTLTAVALFLGRR